MAAPAWKPHTHAHTLATLARAGRASSTGAFKVCTCPLTWKLEAHGALADTAEGERLPACCVLCCSWPWASRVPRSSTAHRARTLGLQHKRAQRAMVDFERCDGVGRDR